MPLSNTIQIYEKCPTVVLPNGLTYIKHPIADWVVTPAIFNEIIDWFSNLLKPNLSGDVIFVWEEDLWWHLVSLMGLALQKPYTLMRRGTQGLTGDISMPFENLYTKWSLHLNGIKPGSKVIIIEDMIDTWWTMIAMINALRTINADIIDVVSVCDRPEKNWRNRIKEATGIMPKVLFSIHSEWERIRCEITSD